MLHTRLAAALGAAVLTLTLGACGDDSTGDPTAADPSSASPSDPAADPAAGSADIEAASLSMRDPWVKSAAKGMTAAFGTLVNAGDGDITVTAAISDVATTTELHETVQNDDGAVAMQPKEGGFTIPAGGEHELAPGGDHLMLMDLARALKPGETVTIRLELEDGSTTEVDATVKKFTGADEKYQDHDMADMADMDTGGSDS